MDPGQAPPPQDFDALRARLVAGADNLPKRLRQAAAYAVDHPDEIAFGSAASIAARAHVQPSTLVRFAQALGYGGFSELQRVFRSRLRDRWPDYPERMRAISPAVAEADGPARFLTGFIDAAESSLAQLRRGLPPATLESAIALLAGAQTIYVLGQRRAFPMAVYIAYALSKLGIKAILIDNVGSLAPEQMLNAGAQDGVIAISFAPYTQTTVELTAAAKERGVPVVAITDSAFSPLAPHAAAVFEIVEADYAAFRSISATFCLGMALAVGIGDRRSSARRRRKAKA
jgi:DNA-binding MurR/RpiR family transcriptional regulator